MITPGLEEVVSFYRMLLREHDLFTDPLVLDETVYVSKKKYDIPYRNSVKFLSKFVIPNVRILPVGLAEYLKGEEVILEKNIPPSDALWSYD